LEPRHFSAGGSGRHQQAQDAARDGGLKEGGRGLRLPQGSTDHPGPILKGRHQE
jgi:hypothetical protein